MRRSTSFAIALASVSAMALTAAGPADAACRKMGFVVNDYGKDGPTRDAQALLEKDIAKWAAGQGIAKYTVGKKDVTCELFLNFIVFDEHTCTASATVCWDEKAPAGKPGAVQDAKATGDAPAAAPAKTATEKPVTTEAKKEAVKPAAEQIDTKKSELPKTEVKPEKSSAKVETGTVPAKTIDAPSAAAVTGQPAAASPDKDPSQAAAAAAERAAAAAERAAIAAERAAQAAQDAQQAPASAAPAVVQPITPLPSIQAQP
jgi:hypothetical protein